MSTQTPPLAGRDILAHWDDLTRPEVDWIDGCARRLIDALMVKYGLSRDEAARQVEDFLRRRSRV